MPTVLSPEQISSNVQIVGAQHTTVAAVDTVATGLRKVLLAFADFDDDPVVGAMHVQAVPGDQAGTILIKTWKSTDAIATLIAATTFGKKVSWLVMGY